MVSASVYLAEVDVTAVNVKICIGEIQTLDASVSY